MTRPQVAVTARAAEDVDQAIAYHLSKGADDVAFGFIDGLADARQLLAEHPHVAWSRLTAGIGLSELRTFAIPRYPYVLVIAERADAVLIVRVLHTSRDVPAEPQ